MTGLDRAGYDAGMRKTLFTKAIRRAIRGSGKTYSEIGREAGLSQQNVSTWYKGHIPSVINADALLRALGVKMVIGDPEGEDLEL